jgi:hypothetical protein
VHRWHRHEHVVRSCMIGLVEAMLSVQPETLLGIADTVTEAVNWFTDVAREGLSKESVEVAHACASEISKHLKNVNKISSEFAE